MGSAAKNAVAAGVYPRQPPFSAAFSSDKEGYLDLRYHFMH